MIYVIWYKRKASLFVLFVIFVFVLFGVWYKQKNQEQTYEEKCYWTWHSFETKINACWEIIKQAKKNYNTIESEREFLKSKTKLENQIAEKSRNEIKKATKEFYEKNLSGSNFVFQ
jgi:hypothetical protein